MKSEEIPENSQAEYTDNTFIIYPFSEDILSITGKKFTNREIDVMSCIISSRSSSIPSFLSISQRTLEVHIRNITTKIGCNSREAIIDFIESSSSLLKVKAHYRRLAVNKQFEKCLAKIAATVNLREEKKYYFVNLEKFTSKIYSYFETNINNHLSLSGIKKATNINNSDCLLTLNTSQYEIFLKECNDNIKKDDSNDIIIEFKTLTDDGKKYFLHRENYYFCILNIIQQIYIKNDLAHLMNDFKKQYDLLNDDSFSKQTESSEKIDKKPKYVLLQSSIKHVLNFSKKIKTLIFIFFLFLLFFLLFRNSDQAIIDLNIPGKSVLLERTDILNQIIHSFNAKKKDMIVYVGLVGIGGAGKTILARSYAKRANHSIAWEIKATTHATIINSFKEFAYILADNKDLKNELSFILSIEKNEQQEKELMSFIKNQLKKNSNWLLIYDNVDSLNDHKDFFPIDKNVWGIGNVIVTTRNKHVLNPTYLEFSHTIQVEQLKEEESIAILCSILYQESPNALSVTERKKIISFLSKIPPFPLDVSVAAYYIKNASLTFDQYIDRITTNKFVFDKNQCEFIKEISDYTQTRYSLISSSLKKIMELNPEYKDLLFLIFQLDSTKIPLDFLNFYKDPLLIDKFVYDLQKFSLITKNSYINNKKDDSFFSMHKSMQLLGKLYLLNTFSASDQQDLYSRYIEIIENFYETHKKNNSQTVGDTIPHLEMFLANIKENKNIVNMKDKYIQKISFIIGCMYYKIKHNLTLANNFLVLVDEMQPQTNGIAKKKMPELLQDLGTISVLTNNLDKVLGYCERSNSISSDSSHPGLLESLNLKTIGSYYRKINQTDKSKKFLELALNKIKDVNVNDKNRFEAGIYTELSFLYNNNMISQVSDMGIYYAKEALKTLNSYENLRNKTDVNLKELSCIVAECKWMLGQAYSRRGRFKKALDEGFLEAIYVMENASDGSSSNLLLKGRIAEGIGEALLREGAYQESVQEFKKTIQIYEQILGSFTTLSSRVYLIEALIQLNKLDEAYAECLEVFKLERRAGNPHLKIINMTALYHAVIIQYKKNNVSKAYEYLIKFMEEINPFCLHFLSPKAYNTLKSENAFLIENVEIENKKNITKYIGNCTKIYKAIYNESLYGADHPFLKNYVEKQ